MPEFNNNPNTKQPFANTATGGNKKKPKPQPTISESGAAHAKLTWNRTPEGQKGYWEYPAKMDRLKTLSAKLTKKMNEAKGR